MATEFSAACESCDWRAQTQDPHSQVLASFDAKRHVNATGHEVVWREATVRSGRYVRSHANVRLDDEPLRVEDGIGDDQ